MAVYVNGKKVAGRGIPGKSPYQIAVSEGYTGTEQDFNTQLGAIGDAVAGFNELSEQVDNAKTDVNNAVSQGKSEIEQAKQNAINSIPNTENLMTAVWSYGETAPDTGYSGDEAAKRRKLLWIDSDTSTGGLKYYDGSSWVHVPVAWA